MLVVGVLLQPSVEKIDCAPDREEVILKEDLGYNF